MTQTHEHKREFSTTEIGSDKSFGVVFGFVFLIIFLGPFLFSRYLFWWALPVSFTFFMLAFLRPSLLRLPNYVWFRFGLFLHKIISPIIMAAVYILTILPIGLFFKVRGKNLLILRKPDSVGTYWVVRDVPGPSAESFKKQF